MSAIGKGVTVKQDALIQQIRLKKAEMVSKYGPSIKKKWAKRKAYDDELVI